MIHAKRLYRTHIYINLRTFSVLKNSTYHKKHFFPLLFAIFTVFIFWYVEYLRQEKYSDIWQLPYHHYFINVRMIYISWWERRYSKNIHFWWNTVLDMYSWKIKSMSSSIKFSTRATICWHDFLWIWLMMSIFYAFCIHFSSRTFDPLMLIQEFEMILS